MKTIIAAIEGISRTAGWAGAILVAPLIAALVYEVLSRYVLAAPTMWSYEMSYMLMGAIFMLSLAYALQARLHVEVGLISSVMPIRLKAFVDLVGYCVFFVVLVWTCVGLFDTTLESYNRGEVSGKSAWNPVIWPIKVVWFISMIVFALQVFAEILRSLGILISRDQKA